MQKIKTVVAFLIGIAFCVALLMKTGRINQFGWDLSPFPHSKTSLLLRKDRLTLYSLQIDAEQQRQAGNLLAAEKDYRTIISGPITLREGNDYVVKAYVNKACLSLKKVQEEEARRGAGNEAEGMAKATKYP